MENDDKKQRKIIMKFNGEKKEILYNDSANGSQKSSSKRKSTERSLTPSKRKKSSERISSSSKNKPINENKTIKESPASEHKNSEKSVPSSSNHKSSEKSKKSSSEHKSSEKSKKSSSEHKSKSKEKKSEIKENISLPENSSKSESKSKEKSSSSKHKCASSSSKHKSKSTEKSSNLESEQKTSEKSSSSHKSSKKSKDNSSNHPSTSESKQRSSSSTSKSEKPSKRSKSSCSEKSSKSSSSQSKKRKSNSDESKKDSKERKSKGHDDQIMKEIKRIRKSNEAFLTGLMQEFREQAKQIMDSLQKIPQPAPSLPEIDPKPSSPFLSDKEVQEKLAMINAPPFEYYPDEDFEYIFIDGVLVPKCRFEYFTDPKDNVMKFRKVADYGHRAQNLSDLEKCLGIEDESLKTSNKVPNETEKSAKDMAKLVQNTEIPLHEITNIQKNNVNKNVKIESIKSEATDENGATKPVAVFNKLIETGKIPSDSKFTIDLGKVKSEPQPHCSKYIPPNTIKQELSVDSNEYFRVIPQNPTSAETPIIEDPEKLKTLADMSVINKWMGSHNKNHGYKDKDTLNLMLNKKSLFSLFKCMGINCCYATISHENFLDHLNFHIESDSLVNECFLNCPYCLDKFTEPIDLIKHYKNVHFNCIYQCNSCFYRAAEKQSVYDHQEHYHKNDPGKHEILECPNVFPKDEKIEESKAIKKVKDIKDSIICELCFEKFINPEDYISHLKSTHQDIEEKDMSEEQVRKMSINFTNNRIGKYQCLECDSTKPFGSNNRIEMRTHLHQHPRSLHFVCVRETDQYKHIRIKSRGDLEVTKYNGDLEVLENSEGILKITSE